jgi:hypothetical protein
MKPTGSPPPRPVFRSLPAVESIESTGEYGSYRVVLREPGGEAKAAVFSVVEGPGGLTGARPDWDIFWMWPGDAQSVRSIIDQVVTLHEEASGAL